MAIDIQQIRSEVEKFWSAFVSKAGDVIESFYLPESTVFSSVSHRPEPGRLAAARRKKEYFNPQSRIKVQLGTIEVQSIGNNAAVASYTFEFHATRVLGALSKGVEEDIQNGRATQVFVQQPDGRLCILHEHLSYLDKP